MTHVSATTESETFMALREHQRQDTATVLVARSPTPPLTINDLVAEVRENTARLESRFDGMEERFESLEKRVDDNNTALIGRLVKLESRIDEHEDRMGESTRLIDGRFDELKRWGDAIGRSVTDLAANQNLFMVEMRVGPPGQVILLVSPRLIVLLGHGSRVTGEAMMSPERSGGWSSD